MLQKWCVQYLSLAVTKAAGLLRKAAEQRNDEHILLQAK